MAMYSHVFGIREPYRVLCDGNFLQVKRADLHSGTTSMYIQFMNDGENPITKSAYAMMIHVN
jgi:hypothetical protein